MSSRSGSEQRSMQCSICSGRYMNDAEREWKTNMELSPDILPPSTCFQLRDTSCWVWPLRGPVSLYGFIIL